MLSLNCGLVFVCTTIYTYPSGLKQFINRHFVNSAIRLDFGGGQECENKAGK